MAFIGTVDEQAATGELREVYDRLLRSQGKVADIMTNGCSYCVQYHAEALNSYWKDSERVQRLTRGFRYAGLSQRDARVRGQAYARLRDRDGSGRGGAAHAGF